MSINWSLVLAKRLVAQLVGTSWCLQWRHPGFKSSLFVVIIKLSITKKCLVLQLKSQKSFDIKNLQILYLIDKIAIFRNTTWFYCKSLTTNNFGRFAVVHWLHSKIGFGVQGYLWIWRIANGGVVVANALISYVNTLLKEYLL